MSPISQFIVGRIKTYQILSCNKEMEEDYSPVNKEKNVKIRLQTSSWYTNKYTYSLLLNITMIHFIIKRFKACKLQ